MRIVSLLPSATEICFALGAGDDVVGVTFECDYPVEARRRRVVSTTALPPGLTPAEIDAVVRDRVAAGKDLYRLDRDALRELNPDVVITQDLCAVCALDVDDVTQALDYLGCQAEVVTTDPPDLQGVLASIQEIGTAIGRPSADIARSLTARLDQIAPATSPCRVALLEWTDPPYAPGHWLPEMIARAGGIDVLGSAGRRSVPITWDAIAAAEPDLVISAPCGYDTAEAAKLTADLVATDVLPPAIPVWAVDANAYFARPGPRLVDGVELLAAILRDGSPDPDRARLIR